MNFLSATWKHLLMANYSVDPGVLKPFVPSNTHIDVFEGHVFVSLVAFLFVIANPLFCENYVALPMDHGNDGKDVWYAWGASGESRFSATVDAEPHYAEGSAVTVSFPKRLKAGPGSAEK